MSKNLNKIILAASLATASFGAAANCTTNPKANGCPTTPGTGSTTNNNTNTLTANNNQQQGQQQTQQQGQTQALTNTNNINIAPTVTSGSTSNAAINLAPGAIKGGDSSAAATVNIAPGAVKGGDTSSSATVKDSGNATIKDSGNATVKDSGNSSSTSGVANSGNSSSSLVNNITFKQLPGFVNAPGQSQAVGCFVAEGWRATAGASAAIGGVASVGVSGTSSPDAEDYKAVPGCNEQQIKAAAINAGLQPNANKNIALLAVATVAGDLGEGSAFAQTFDKLKSGDKATREAADLFAPVVPTTSNTTYVQPAAAVAQAPAAPQQVVYIVKELPKAAYNAAAKNGVNVATPDALKSLPCTQWTKTEVYACTAGPAAGKAYSFH